MYSIKCYYAAINHCKVENKPMLHTHLLVHLCSKFVQKLQIGFFCVHPIVSSQTQKITTVASHYVTAKPASSRDKPEVFIFNFIGTTSDRPKSDRGNAVKLLISIRIVQLMNFIFDCTVFMTFACFSLEWMQSITRTLYSWTHNINTGKEIKEMARENGDNIILPARALGRFHLISRNAVIGRLGLVITRTSCWIVVCRSTTVSSKSWSAPFLATSETDIGTPSLPTGITTCRCRPYCHQKTI